MIETMRILLPTLLITVSMLYALWLVDRIEAIFDAAPTTPPVRLALPSTEKRNALGMIIPRGKSTPNVGHWNHHRFPVGTDREWLQPLPGWLRMET